MKRTPFIGWVIIALLVASVGSGFYPSDPLRADEAAGVYVYQAFNPNTDTLFGVDSLVTIIRFRKFQELDWVHAVAPTVAGGDSATISSVKVWLTNETGLGSSFWYHSELTTAVAGDSSYTLTIPMALGVRIVLHSTADQDTTIIGGYYIYR